MRPKGVGETEGSVHRWRWRFRRCSNSHDSLWACSVNGTHAFCVLCAAFQYTCAKAGVVHNPSGGGVHESEQLGLPLHTRLADRALCAYKTPGYRRILRLQNRKMGLGRPRAQRPKTATATTTAGQHPSPYPRTPHRRYFRKTEPMWCAWQDALASDRLPYVEHIGISLQRKTTD